MLHSTLCSFSSKIVLKCNSEQGGANFSPGLSDSMANLSENVGQDKNDSSNKNGSSFIEDKIVIENESMMKRLDIKLIFKRQEQANAAKYRRRRLGIVGREMNVQIPSIQQLLDAERIIYIENTLNEVILNYGGIVSWQSLLNENLDLNDIWDENDILDEKTYQLYTLFENVSNMQDYEAAVYKLKEKNDVNEAKRLLLHLVNEAVEPAIYVYVIVFFKEILEQCDLFNNNEENVQLMKAHGEDIRTAVELLKCANLMEPAPSFLLGMLKRFNIGECSRFMEGSWKNDLIHVVEVGRHSGFFQNIEEWILEGIDYEKTWNKCSASNLCMKKKYGNLKEMATYSLYEITLSMTSQTFYNANACECLFKLLCQKEFSPVLYTYGATLLLGESLKQNIKLAIECLDRATLAGHKGAKFLIGTLPFNDHVNYTLTPKKIRSCLFQLERVCATSNDLCKMNEKNVNEVAYRLALEYYSKKSCMVGQNKHKAEKLLSTRKLYKELSDLQSREERDCMS